jgi:hypothetical protein
MDITKINNARLKTYVVDYSMSNVTTVDEAVDSLKNDIIRTVCRPYGFPAPDPSDDDASSVVVYPDGTSLLLIACLPER